MRTAMLAWFVFLVISPELVQSQTVKAVQAPLSCTSVNRRSFDLASIKPIDGSSGNSSVTGTPDGVILRGSLRSIIRVAYGVHDFQLIGGPDWVDTKMWEIHAKNDVADANYYNLDHAEMRALRNRRMEEVQSLLADRFAFKCHVTTKEMATYDLVVAKGGPKLKQTSTGESKQGSDTTVSHGLQMHATATSVGMDRVVNMLGNEVDRMVVDKTGLTGTYDVSMDWVRDAPSGTEAPPGPTIFAATQEQLGLKLVRSRGPVPLLVIDGAQKASAN